MSETFYRLHGTSREFSAENAWSSSTNLARSKDGSEYECECSLVDGPAEECRVCDGTGWAPCDRGYSCFTDPQELARYFGSGLDLAADDRVIIFTGYRAGSGEDGEDLAVPESVTEILTWAEFTTRTAAACS
jgi:hypothetical protein